MANPTFDQLVATLAAARQAFLAAQADVGVKQAAYESAEVAGGVRDPPQKANAGQKPPPPPVAGDLTTLGAALATARATRATTKAAFHAAKVAHDAALAAAGAA